MILLDATVLVEYIRKRDERLAKALNELDLGICGVTRAELMHGARDDEDEQKLLLLLDQFTQVSIPHDIWDKLGHRLRELRSRGIIVPFTDALLATLAVEQDLEIWSNDKHFRLMAQVFPLKLYQH